MRAIYSRRSNPTASFHLSMTIFLNQSWIPLSFELECCSASALRHSENVGETCHMLNSKGCCTVDVLPRKMRSMELEEEGQKRKKMQEGEESISS